MAALQASLHGEHAEEQFVRRRLAEALAEIGPAAPRPTTRPMVPSRPPPATDAYSNEALYPPLPQPHRPYEASLAHDYDELSAEAPDPLDERPPMIIERAQRAASSGQRHMPASSITTNPWPAFATGLALSLVVGVAVYFVRM